ncbi:lipopolysaccharide biosynthesis protein [Paucibacter sp. TC2R-5]|uniref:Wzz/FepE/Etk N-terminal domain-containing protein n=1 Tax=Paucibacter sp. TC2R-5 TaxID=2893555 RepID=UPI0021E4902C|nr:Wzz/FepE/Etk N-terminal domain-containing protein [Paucibacter sp. TC2R-5]MCV2357357.1 lipopolysaccharide biosynthesis protein [Paucibacter sp. TC2R-5]
MISESIGRDYGAFLPVTQVNPIQDGKTPHAQQEDDDGIDLLDLLTILAAHWRLLTFGPIVVGAIAFGATYSIAPTFTSKSTFLPPQQQQSSAASALASLGALSGLAGGGAGIKSPGDQYVALMQSVNVQDSVIDRFKLMDIYQAKYRFQARAALQQNVRISLGKKDGLITVEADAKEPNMAADLANQYVAELRRLSGELALTEAQQRRAFFEAEVKRTQIKLAEAQKVLQSSGFNPGALKAEPKAAAEGYASLKAQLTGAEVRLQIMQRGLAESAPELQQQTALLGALRAQLSKIESSSENGEKKDSDYISRYREYKYQETLFEMFSKQFELARLDESREGAMIQVVDIATPAEWKSKPQRVSTAVTAAFSTFFLLLVLVLVKSFFRNISDNPAKAEKLSRLRAAVRGRN